MLQVALPVDLPAQVVPGVDHLVAERVLEVLAVAHLVGAQQDAAARVEPAALAVHLAVLGEPGGAPAAHDVGRVQVPVQRPDLLPQEAHRRAVRKRPVPELLAPLAVGFFVDAVPLLPVVEHALGRHVARQDLEVVDPPLGLRVEAGARRVVLDDGRKVGIGGGGGRRRCCARRRGRRCCRFWRCRGHDRGLNKRSRGRRMRWEELCNRRSGYLMRRSLGSFDSYLESIVVQGHTARQIRALDSVVLMVVTTVRVCGDFFFSYPQSIN